MEASEIINCAFHKWYFHFKEVSVFSKIININDDAMDYISSDGLILPSDLVDQSDNLKLFFADITKAIEELGGFVVPKFTWSVPSDAKWISHDKSLKCSSLDEVMLLIKSSDFVTHDIDHAFDDCRTKDVGTFSHKLNLREWTDITPSSEFRCFVKNNHLIGISQRHCDTCYSDLSSKANVLKEAIVDFFSKNIQSKFPSSNFAFDVFVNDLNEVKLLDFNPFVSPTDSLLFTWEELKADSVNDNALEFRVVENDGNILSNPYQWHSYPMDFLHLSAGMDYNKFTDLLQSKDLIKSTDSDFDD